jgi:hypothetical protein
MLAAPLFASRTRAVHHYGGDWLPWWGRPKAHPGPFGATGPCLVARVAPFTCILSFPWPPFRLRPSPRVELPSPAGTDWCLAGRGGRYAGDCAVLAIKARAGMGVRVTAPIPASPASTALVRPLFSYLSLSVFRHRWPSPVDTCWSFGVSDGIHHLSPPRCAVRFVFHDDFVRALWLGFVIILLDLWYLESDLDVWTSDLHFLYVMMMEILIPYSELSA